MNKIISHGIFWVNNNKQINCPECNCNQVKYEIHQNNKEAKCCCNSCKCIFTIERGEDSK